MDISSLFLSFWSSKSGLVENSSFICCCRCVLCPQNIFILTPCIIYLSKSFSWAIKCEFSLSLEFASATLEDKSQSDLSPSNSCALARKLCNYQFFMQKQFSFHEGTKFPCHCQRFNLELSNDFKINCTNLSILKCSQRIEAK